MHRIIWQSLSKKSTPWLAAALATTVVSAVYVDAPEKNQTLSFYTPSVASSEPARKRTSKRTLQRRRTIQNISLNATKAPLESKYIWHVDKVLGEGAYGSVYLATSKATDEHVALKKISKQQTNSTSFQQEMNCMMLVKSKGGHPHVCGLHEHFDTPENYYIVLDYIGGGEMFDHLIDNGAYSEWDAARLVREVASALNFLHGIGVVHADLKPENILLSTKGRGDSVVKLADFGCAQILENTLYSNQPTYGAPTPAYAPPESITKTHPIAPAADMWGLGVILFIMLTGCHPYDISGDAEDDVIEARISDPRYRIPLHNRKITGHLSQSAKNVIQGLMERNPSKRLTALQMLQNPWTRGATATLSKIQGSDARLSKFRKIQSRLQANFFESAVMESDASILLSNNDGIKRKTSLVERSFQTLDLSDLDGEVAVDNMSMSDFQNLLSTNIKHQHFPAGHVIYQQGDIGNHMYFIDSGTVTVKCQNGSRARRSQGDFFGEGALLHPQMIRSATVQCVTPVHAHEISREYFEKFLKTTNKELYLTLKEKDKIRKRNRAKTILKLQKNTKTTSKKKGQHFFEEGKTGDSLFILDRGKVDLSVQGNAVFSATEGNIFGEHSVLTGRLRNCTATCVTSDGCVAKELSGSEFRKLSKSSPTIQQSLRELQLRREFKKAVVLRLKKEFPYQNPAEAFDCAVVLGNNAKTDELDHEGIMQLMRDLSPDYTDEEIKEVIEALNLTESGTITFEEFKKVFVGDIRTSASM